MFLLKKRLLLKLFSAFTFVIFFTSCFIFRAQAREHSVIVGFHNKPGPSEKALLHGHGGKIKHQFRHISAYTTSLSDLDVQRLRKDPKVKYVIDDIIYQVIDPVDVAGDPLEYENSWGVEHIGSLIAHSNNISGKGIRIALLDTGMDYTHQDLATNYKGGWDFVFNDSDPYDDSWNSHGTHVAGIIAAVADGNGVIGVAQNAELYAVKVLDGGGFGLLSWIIEGIEWAVDNEVDIVNISIGGRHSVALMDACDAAYNAGVLLVAAAGNGTEVAYPAAYDSVIAVTGTDNTDQLGWFAPLGSQVELTAPGVIIQSTSADNTYAELSGTSQAAPHVTGMAALILSAGTYDLNNDNIVNNQDVRIQMQMSAKDLGDVGKDDFYGFGLIDVAAALELSTDAGDSSLTFELIKGSRHRQDNEIVNLSGMPFQITITNNSLQSLRVVVFENGKRRKDLSQKIHFNKRSPQVVSFSLDASNRTFQVVFVPGGKPGASATIAIDE